MVKIADRIKQLRKKKGVSQSQLAEAIEELPFFGVVPKPLYVTNIRSTGSFLKLICLIRGSREVCMMNVR